MKYFYVCHAKNAGVRFPKDTKRLGAWLIQNMHKLPIKWPSHELY